MPLLKCWDLEGSETIIEQDPAILTLPDVMYVPFNHPHLRWGVYDHGGRLVPPCAYFRGPGSGALGNELMTPLRYNDVVTRAPDEVYIYGGFLHGHYGHFLLSTLSRYWFFDRTQYKGIKILYHAQESIADLFQKQFFADSFGAMGLFAEDFVCFEEPVRINKLIVPCPSFEETGFAHRAFSIQAHKIGDILTKAAVIERSDTPVYLSKARLRHGVGHLVNEEEFADVLSRQGVDVVYPEQLSLAEQIALFRSRPLIAALTGSALHTSVFASRRTIVGLSYGNTLYSSYTMIDHICDHQGHYFHPQEDIELLPRSAEFHLDYRLTKLHRTASQFLRLVEMAARLSRDKTVFRGSADSILHNPVSVSNIAKDKPARQSSFGPREMLVTPSGYLSTATSGVLTGRYQFHTDHEDQPWWEVDLGSRHTISEIRMHNRSDNSQARAGCFVILISDDGVSWVELHRQDAMLIFGNGLDDAAFAWKAHARTEGRVIRLALLTTNFFHLDQVEVFGRPL